MVFRAISEVIIVLEIDKGISVLILAACPTISLDDVSVSACPIWRII
jgi:hypothetical protein